MTVESHKPQLGPLKQGERLYVEGCGHVTQSLEAPWLYCSVSPEPPLRKSPPPLNHGLAASGSRP